MGTGAGAGRRSLDRSHDQCGRLFDAIAALAGGRRVTSYEGQTAAELEAAAVAHVGSTGASDVTDDWVGAPDADPWVLDPSPLIADALARRLAGRSSGEIAASFHRTLAAGLVRGSVVLAKRAGVGTVALTGGVFQNDLLTALVAAALAAAGLEVLVHETSRPTTAASASARRRSPARTGEGVPRCTGAGCVHRQGRRRQVGDQRRLLPALGPGDGRAGGGHRQ